MRQILLFTLCLCFSFSLYSKEDNQKPIHVVKPKISIVIDDLGDNSIIARKMLSLPVKMTAAILPHTPHANLISDFATAKGHDVIMHLPMEAFTRPDLLGPGALFSHMPKPELQKTLLTSANSIPHMIGFNNHMGSLLTENKEKMRWVMESAKQKGWFFLDSKTSEVSVAQSIAEEVGVASIGRDLFLDHQGHAPSIANQFKLMQKIAKRRGHVVAICHPYPETLAFLADNLVQLDEKFELVGVSELLINQLKSGSLALSP